MENIHTAHHNKDNTGRSVEIESYIDKTVDWIIGTRVPFNSVLDVGCDYGYMLNRFKINYGVKDITGIDPYSNYNPYSVDILNVDMCEDNFSSNFHRLFGLATFNHTLEHVRNPYKAIENIKKVLSPYGFVFLGLPVCGHDWAYWEGHYSIWNSDWAKRFMEINGFKMVACKDNVCFRGDNVEFWGLFTRA